MSDALTCRACGHAHTQADWEYQAGHCHACGAPLTIPNDPRYASWRAGPESKAAEDLHVAEQKETQSRPDPGPLPTGKPPAAPEAPHAPPSYPPPPPPDDDEEDDDEDEHELAHNEVHREALKIPESVKVDRHGKVVPPPKKKKGKRK